MTNAIIISVICVVVVVVAWVVIRSELRHRRNLAIDNGVAYLRAIIRNQSFGYARKAQTMLRNAEKVYCYLSDKDILAKLTDQERAVLLLMGNK